MKRLALITFVFFVSLFSSCEKTNIDNDFQTRINSSYTRVSYNDALHYVQKHTDTRTKSDAEAFHIEPVVDKSLDTLLYIVNYENGWKILSTDKRVPAEVAYGDTGTIDLNTENPAFLSWLSGAAKDMKVIRATSDEGLSFSNDDIRFNISRWGGINPRSIDPDMPLDEIEVIDTLDYTEPVTVVPHMVQANWDQDYPYNQFCPVKTGGGNYDVGCAGVAAGSLLHHLYRTNLSPTLFSGIPMDSIAVVYSDENSDSLEVTARYLKAVNDQLDMHYLSSGSFAFPSDVKDFFDNNDYPCTYGNFDAEIVKNSLQYNHCPVIILAFDNLWDILEIPTVWTGHYFLIDGYQTRRHVIVEHHYTQGIGANPVPSHEWDVYLYIGNPYFAFVKMNWGWSSQWTSGTNDGWYALTSSWVTNVSTFDNGRHMFYGFN